MSNLYRKTREDELRDELSERGSDRAAMAVRSLASLIPTGAIWGEWLASGLPHQRSDRVIDVIVRLDTKLHLQEGQLQELFLANAATQELLEEGLLRAGRAPSEERRERIACLLANGLSGDETRAQESSYLLRLFSEINDVELIWLSYFFLGRPGKLEPEQQEAAYAIRKKYEEQHRDVLFVPAPRISSTREEVNASALGRSYKSHLASLGLLDPKYREVDTGTGVSSRRKPKVPDVSSVTGYGLSDLGRILIREVGLAEELLPGMFDS